MKNKIVRYKGSLDALKVYGIGRDVTNKTGKLVDITGDNWGVVEYEFECPIRGVAKEEYDIPMHSLEEIK